jgi:hypothetical protein
MVNLEFDVVLPVVPVVPPVCVVPVLPEAVVAGDATPQFDVRSVSIDLVEKYNA